MGGVVGQEPLGAEREARWLAASPNSRQHPYCATKLACGAGFLAGAKKVLDKPLPWYMIRTNRREAGSLPQGQGIDLMFR
jgi:hypothetical protein